MRIAVTFEYEDENDDRIIENILRDLRDSLAPLDLEYLIIEDETGEITNEL